MSGDPTLYARFERDGENAVRDNLARGAYLLDHAVLAREWLRRCDQSAAEEAERIKAASSLEQIRIARSAKNAAWAAAIMAITAVIISIVSILLTLFRK